MKRYLCAIVALIILSALLCIHVSAATCDSHITDGMPFGVEGYFEAVDNDTHNVCYTCDICYEKVVVSTEAHDVSEVDNKCSYCGFKVHTHTYKIECEAVDENKHIERSICPCGYVVEEEKAHEFFTFASTNDLVCMRCEYQIHDAGEDGVVPPVDDPSDGGGDATTPPPEDEGNEILKEALTKSEEIVAWIMDNFEEISVVCTMILTTILTIRKLSILFKSAITMNNNTVTVANNSEKVMQEASDTVGSYVDAMTALLAEVRCNAEEREKIVAKLDEATRLFNTAKLANMELANEVAELLCLANIPNSKKEELYSRHRAAVQALAAAEKTEVKADVETEVGEA